MLFGTTISLPLCVVVLVVCLGRNVSCLEESFKLFRGKRDIFSNPKCSQPGGSNCRDSCDELAAKCKDLDCSYCVCGNNGGKNTYLKNSSSHGKCVKEEKIAPCSGRYTFSKSKAVLLFLRPKDCGSCSSNYENHLEPISFRLKKNMCTINWLDSEYQRHGDTWKPVNVQNTFFYIEKFNNRKKRLRVSGSAFNAWNGSLIKLNFNCHRVTRKNISKSEEGCVLLKFETIPKYKQVPTTSKPRTNRNSKATHHQQNVVSTVTPYFEITWSVLKTATMSPSLPTTPSKSVLSSRSTGPIKPTAVNTMITEFPNGKKQTNTLTNSPTLTTLSSKSDPNTIQATKEHLSPVSTTTTSKSFSSNTVTSFPLSTTISPNSDRIRGSTLILKAITISLSIVLLVVILCLVAAFFVFCRRRKRSKAKQRTEEDETQLYEDPSQMYQPLNENRRGVGDEHPYQELLRLGSQGRDTSLHVQTNSTSLGVQDEYSTASTENLARSFSPSQPLPSTPVVQVYQVFENSDTSDNTTCTSEDDRLSENIGNDLKNEPLGDQQCTKSPLYQTLEDEEIAQNPELKLDAESTDKSLDSAAEESIHEQCQSPIYQTLDDEEIAQNPELKLDAESTDKSLDSAAEESIHEQCQSPIYQTLDDEEIAQNPELKLDAESTDKSLDSAAEESIHEQCQSPIYQTLDDEEIAQNPELKLDAESTDKSLDFAVEESIGEECKSPIYQTLDDQEIAQNPELKLDEESTNKSLDSVTQESLHRHSQNPIFPTPGDQTTVF